jgi:hypothetical protein
VEFVEADQAVFFRDALGDFVERIGHALQFIQLMVHGAHEFVEMQARLAHDRDHRIKAVHQEGFTPPHPAPHVDAARHVGTVDEALESGRPLGLVLDPVVVRLLEAVDRGLLGGVGFEAALGEGVLVKLLDVHVVACLAAGRRIIHVIRKMDVGWTGSPSTRSTTVCKPRSGPGNVM